MQASISVNYGDYDKRLSNAKEKLKDLKPVLLDFEKYYRGLMQKNYYSQGSIFGQWQKNSANYEKQKKEWVTNKTIMENGKPAIRLEAMRLTDELRKSVFSDNIVDVDKNSISYTLMNEYGYRLHATRPFLYSVKEKDGLRQQDKVRFLKMIEKYIEGENE